MIRLTCPQCNCNLTAPDKAQGHSSRCGQCGCRFIVPPAPTPASTMSPPNKTVLGDYLSHHLPEPNAPQVGTATAQLIRVSRHAIPDQPSRRPHVLGCLILLFNLVIFSIAGLVYYVQYRPDETSEAKAPDKGKPPQDRQKPPEHIPDDPPHKQQAPKGKKNEGHKRKNERETLRETLREFFQWSQRWQDRLAKAQEKGNPLVIQDIQEKRQQELKEWEGRQLEGTVEFIQMWIDGRRKVRLTVSVRLGPGTFDQLYCDVANSDDPALRKLERGRLFRIQGTLRTWGNLSLDECKVYVLASDPDEEN